MNNLRTARKLKRLTQKDVAELVGIDRTTYNRYENGMTQPDNDKLLKLATVLDVSVDYLLGNKPQIEHGATRLIPLLGTVPAGTPIEAIEDIEEYIDIYPRLVKHGELFALRVQGDSMEPDLRSGDIIIVEKQDFAESGDIVFLQ